MPRRMLILVALLLAMLLLMLWDSGLEEDSRPPSAPGPEAPLPETPRQTPPAAGMPDEDPSSSGPVTPPNPGEPEDRPSEKLVIAGIVLRQDGITPATAWVSVSPVDPEAVGANFLSEDLILEGGRFRITDLPPGQYLVEVRPEEGKAGMPPEDLVVPAGAEDLRIVLRPGATVYIRVRHHPESAGWPVTSVKVYDEEGTRIREITYTGPDLEGAFTDLIAGRRYRVEVSSPGFRQRGPVAILLGPNDRSAKVVAHLDSDEGEITAHLTLRVRSDRGEVLTRINVARRINPSLVTGDIRELTEGAVELALPVGESEILLARPYNAAPIEEPWLSQTFRVRLGPGEKAVRDVVVRAGGWVRFHPPEVDPPTVHIVYFGAEGGELRPVIKTRSPSGGGWIERDAKPLVPGRYVAELRRPGFEPVRKDVEVRPGEITDIWFEAPSVREKGR